MRGTNDGLPEGVIVLRPGEGRDYDLGPMRSRFLADGDETGDRYSVSLWWVNARTPGVGAHSHEANDELFWVVEGTMTFHIGDRHIDAPAGTFLRVPAGIPHGFGNLTNARAGVFNVFIPGGFETRMPEIVEWFRSK